MEKANRTLSGRSQLAVVPPSPRLVRSRSGSSSSATITTPEKTSRRFSSTSERFTNGHRSTSTSKVRTYNNEDNVSPASITSISNVQSKFQEKKSKDGFGYKFGVSPDNNNIGASRRATTPSTMKSKSPSAWALSPGRSLGSPAVTKLPTKTSGSGGGGGGGHVSGGVSKVLKYFKQRKVSSVQAEEFHQFRILHNKLLQWRFINARAEIAMTTVKNKAEIQLFSVWLNILVLRKIIIHKRIEMQKIRHMIKLYQIMNPQLSLLNEWAKLERGNQESIDRLTRKLSALSTTMPLTHGLKADTDSVYEAINTAVKVMAKMEPLITKYQTQVERILYQVTELTTASKHEEEYLQELLEIVPMIVTLLVSLAIASPFLVLFQFSSQLQI
ncbi:hypothetical protein RIF29_25393 [Crotalaria pallida]|uniref:QWRF motif-containing protein 7 n=1 Tax=Crotalaria pallida TaxID=3830 RepID=A0AAN9HZR6_CROPI